MKKDINKVLNILFLFSFFGLLFVGFITIFMSPEDKSVLENRQLEKFEVLTIDKFLDGSFQSNLEKAFSDQVLFSKSIKYYSNKYLNSIDYKKLDDSICKNKYVHVKNDYFTFNCDDRIMEGPLDTDSYEKVIEKHLDYLKRINGNKVYYYIIDRAYAYDFQNKKMQLDMYKMIKDNINIPFDHVKRLNVKNYKDYQKYFYKSDHHWNYIGSYQGYKDIIRMLKPDDNILKPIETKYLNNKFYGSASKNVGNYDIYDDFKYYKFNYNNHKVYIDGRESNYGGYDRVLKNEMQYLNYYGEVYGYDYGEVLFDFNDNSKENLMIIASSYSNPINVLIASHYNKTYVYDLRYYNNFKFNELLKDKKIDKVLIILSNDMMIKEDVKLEGEV